MTTTSWSVIINEFFLSGDESSIKGLEVCGGVSLSQDGTQHHHHPPVLLSPLLEPGGPTVPTAEALQLQQPPPPVWNLPAGAVPQRQSSGGILLHSQFAIPPTSRGERQPFPWRYGEQSRVYQRTG